MSFREHLEAQAEMTGEKDDALEIPVMLERGVKMPEKAHTDDAGYDIFSPFDVCILSRSSEVFKTGVHMLIPSGYVGMLKSKSGLNVKKGIRSEGVVDAGYTGEIVVKLYNDTDNYYNVHEGDKITQIVILPIPETRLKQVDRFEKTERGDGGFGSTGR